MRDILYIINWGITPGVGGRQELPVGVDTWLMATQICLNRLQEEGSKK